MRSAHSELIIAYMRPDREVYWELGKKVGRLYTDFGLPLDMAMERLTMYTELQRLLILDGACQWFIEHKRNSNGTEKSIERQRKTNVDILNKFVNGEEMGLY